jgi:hypothetical protein
MIPGVVGFRRGGLWREFFKTFSTYAYMRTFLIKNPQQPTTPANPPQAGTFYPCEERFSGPGCKRTAGGGMVAQFR